MGRSKQLCLLKSLWILILVLWMQFGRIHRNSQEGSPVYIVKLLSTKMPPCFSSYFSTNSRLPTSKPALRSFVCSPTRSRDSTFKMLSTKWSFHKSVPESVLWTHWPLPVPTPQHRKNTSWMLESSTSVGPPCFTKVAGAAGFFFLGAGTDPVDFFFCI